MECSHSLTFVISKDGLFVSTANSFLSIQSLKSSWNIESFHLLENAFISCFPCCINDPSLPLMKRKPGHSAFEYMYPWLPSLPSTSQASAAHLNWFHFHRISSSFQFPIRQTLFTCNDALSIYRKWWAFTLTFNRSTRGIFRKSAACVLANSINAPENDFICWRGNW